MAVMVALTRAWQRGKVRGMHDYKVQARFWSKAACREGEGCWPWRGAIIKNGYGSFHLNGAMVAAHRVAWEIANEKVCPRDGHICHHCDNRRCVNPEHLYLGDHASNMRDKAVRGRARTGEQRGNWNPRSKLTDDGVREIRKLYRETSLSQSAIAAKFGVTQTAVHKVISGQRWSHVE